MYNRDCQPGSTPSPGCQASRGVGEEKRYSHQDCMVVFKGPLATLLRVPPRQLKRMGKGGGKEGGGRAGKAVKHLQLPAVWPHLSSGKESSPHHPEAHHAPAAVCFTPSSRTRKKPTVLLLPLGEDSGRGGGLCFFRSWGGSLARSPLMPEPLASLQSSQVSGGNPVPRGARRTSTQMSERLVGSAGLGVASGRLADDAVRVLAAAAGAAQAVVAALGQLHAAGGGQVAEQAGQHQGEGAHEGPAGAAVGAGAGAGVVGAGALIVLVGAVVEDPLHQAHAGAVVDQGLGGAQALLVADPARGQRPGRRALLALALPAGLAQQEVLVQLGRRCGPLEVQRLAVDGLGLDAHSPRGGLVSHGGRRHVV